MPPNELVAFLNIPVHLTDKDDKALKSYYHKYKACLQAKHTVDDMSAKGQWPAHKKPSLTDLIHLFVSPSMWHSHVKNMSRVSEYPAMQAWFEGGEGALDDQEVWGYSKISYGFKDLKEYFDDQDEARDKKGKGRGKGKGTQNVADKDMADKDVGDKDGGSKKKKKKVVEKGESSKISTLRKSSKK